MFMKIRGAAAGLSNPEWWFYEVDRVHWVTYSEPIDTNAPEFRNWNVSIPDQHGNCYIWLVCVRSKFEKCKDFIGAVGTEVYLLNDHGETVEHIESPSIAEQVEAPAMSK